MKRVCVIGAGASGITAIKCCLDENIEPVCFERSKNFGGLWRYESGEKEGASVYRSIVVNTSKEMVCFSDFPIPQEFPNFMHNSKLIEYFKLYITQFNLLSRIHFDTEVVNCEQADDYDVTGRWKVTTTNRKSKETDEETFDGVLVCTGRHAAPHLPSNTFPDFDKFKGTFLHSNSYKLPFAFQDKRVLVVGIGNSACDIAVELGKHASKVFLSTRRGSWIFSRVGVNGTPFDFASHTRLNSILRDVIPSSFFNWLFEKSLNRKFDHAKYGLKPKHKPLSEQLTVNDSLPNSILSGMVTVKGNVREFTENGVVFEDGTHDEVDAVIFATGYSFNFPFLDDSVIEVRKNSCRLYRHIWPPQLKHGTLAVIGNIQPLGGVCPISEIQSRWATRVIKRDLRLPPKNTMERNIDNTICKMKQSYFCTPGYSIQVDYVQYMDEIADELKVKPSLVKFFKSDFKLAFKLLFGPVTPYQYRLVGHGSWPKAREAIMTQDERMLYPLKTRKVEVEEFSAMNYFLLILFVSLLVYLIF